MAPESNDDSLSKRAEELRRITARLRAPDGCPWDRKQTISSLSEFILEETYEAMEAMDSGNYVHLCEELGDMLSQVFMISQIAEENGKFTVDDVFDGISEKLVYRHPHVFGDIRVNGAEESLKVWNQQKRKEKTERKSPFDGVPKALPSLVHAMKIIRKGKMAGIPIPETPNRQTVEDFAEKAKTLEMDGQETGRNEELEEELGAMLFSLAAIAAKYELNPESALRRQTERYIAEHDPKKE